MMTPYVLKDKDYAQVVYTQHQQNSIMPLSAGKLPGTATQHLSINGKSVFLPDPLLTNACALLKK